MKREILIGIFLVFFAVFSLPLVVSLGIRELPLSEQRSFGGHKKVYGEVVHKTDFVAEENGLLAVGLSFRNFNLQNKKDITLTLLSNGLEVRKVVINGASISDGGLMKFRFAPISDSKGQGYQFEVSAKEANENDALQVFFDSSDSGMNYQLFYRPVSRLSLIKSVYGGWLKHFFADPVFAVFYLVLISALTVYLVSKKLNA